MTHSFVLFIKLLMEYAYEVVSSSTVLLMTCFIILWCYAVRKPKGIPPGPPIYLPGLGNLPSLAGKDPLIVFQTMRQQYGDVYSLFLGLQHIVVLNGYETMKEALVFHGSVFSNRPRDALLNDYLKGNKGIIYSSGPEWKMERKFAASALEKLQFGRPAFENNVLAELNSLISLCENTNGQPFNMKDFIHFSVANIIGVIIRGERAEYGDSVFMKFLSNQEKSSAIIVQGSVVMNSFPIMQYIPGDLFGINFVVESIKYSKTHLGKYHEDHYSTYDENNIRDLMDAYIQRDGKGKCPDEALEVYNDLFGAGTESTTSTLLWIILYLLNYTDVQSKCRHEIHSALGKSQLPTMADKPKLPYVTATILEGLRISNAVIMGTPHAVSEDTVFRGMKIPKKSTLLMNMNSIFHDPELFENPHEFKPERFINDEGMVEIPEYFIPFGIGRRICLGEAAAKMEMFLFLTALLQRFEFFPEEDTPPPIKGNLDVTYNPQPYKIRCLKCT